MVQLVANQPPPPDYYAGNLVQLLDFVARRYHDVLDAADLTVIDAIRHLPVPAGRLFARLLTRKGPWLRVSSLRYAEVGDVDAPLAVLTGLGLITCCGGAPADRLLGLYTRAELNELFPHAARARKSDLLDAVLGRYSDERIRSRLAAHDPWVEVRVAGCLDRCQVLFFGGRGQDLSAFVLRDLGVTRCERYEINDCCFRDRGELDAYLMLTTMRDRLRRLDEMPKLAPHLAARLRRVRVGDARVLIRRRNRLGIELGRWFERRGAYANALACYGATPAHPARERRVRVLDRIGQRDASRRLLAHIRAEPFSPEERLFAERFGRRRGGTDCRTSTITLPGAVPAHIEDFAARLLTANVGQAWHTENAWPLGLAGLAMWPVVFAAVPGAFANPFQSAPLDLFWDDFVSARRSLIDERLRALAEPAQFARLLRTTLRCKRGLANRLVGWTVWTPEFLDQVLEQVDHTVLLAIVRHVIEHLDQSRSGFPDLFVVYGPGVYEFVEVKGPADQLQPNQRLWLGSLARLGVPARVLRFKKAAGGREQ